MSPTEAEADVLAAIRELKGEIEALKTKQDRAPKKGLLELLTPYSSLISGVLLAAVGTVATILYNNRQLQLTRLTALDKYRSYLTSDDQATREFGYQSFYALGEEELALKLIAARSDPAGRTVALQAAADPASSGALRDLAKRALLDLDQLHRIKTILNIFELGKSDPDYAGTNGMGDSAPIAYGRTYARIGGGQLYSIAKLYSATSDGQYRSEFATYLPRLEQADASLNDDAEFKALLTKAGADPVMQSIQETQFDQLTLAPAIAAAGALGVKSALGVAAIYDGYVQGGWQRIRDQTTGKLGGTPATGIDEKIWIKAYLEARRDWLANNPNELLHKSAKRPAAMLQLAEKGNWDLLPPLDVEGVAIEK